MTFAFVETSRRVSKSCDIIFITSMIVVSGCSMVTISRSANMCSAILAKYSIVSLLGPTPSSTTTSSVEVPPLVGFVPLRFHLQHFLHPFLHQLFISSSWKNHQSSHLQVALTLLSSWRRGPSISFKGFKVDGTHTRGGAKNSATSLVLPAPVSLAKLGGTSCLKPRIGSLVGKTIPGIVDYQVTGGSCSLAS